MKTLDQIKKEQSEIEKQAWVKTLLAAIVIILLYFLALICSSCSVKKDIPVYNHLLINEGYLFINYKIDKIEDWQVKRICKKIDKNQSNVIYRSDGFIIKEFNGKKKVKGKYRSYIPVTLDDLNKTKINIFGKEKMILNNRIRNKLIHQID